ncbi:hypothetical protein ACWGS9_07920 [Bradyrhizobium sp. Arg314]
MSAIRIEKASIFKLPDGFNFLPLKDREGVTHNTMAAPAPVNAKQPDRYDLLECRVPTQDSTETLPLSARNREGMHTFSAAIL